MPHARCSPRSGPRGRTSHAAQDPAHLSTMWPRGDIRRCSSVGRAPMRRYVAGLNPAVCVRCMLPHCGIMESKTATRGFPARGMRTAGRINYVAGIGLLDCEKRMRPAYRRRTEKFRGVFGVVASARGLRRLTKGRGGGNLMIRPPCKRFKQGATPNLVKSIKPLAGIEVALRGG